jgi:serine palmitoyltransferase
MDRLLQDLGVVADSAVKAVQRKMEVVPGSAIVMRYIRSSYQNDPARTVLEAFLFLFAMRYFLASKYSYNKQNYVKLTEEEIDELIEQWTPEPLIKPIDREDVRQLDAIPVIQQHNGPIVQLAGHDSREFLNLTSTDVYNINNNDEIKDKAVESIRKYGVGSCGPAGFYGHQDAHGDCEAALANFLGVEGSILYSQGFATASSVIPCFLKRGDVIVADNKLNIGIQKGMQLSRATIFWYEHNNMEDLERVLIAANKTHRRGPLPRRFVITEGIYETQGDSPDLVKMVQLKNKYKYRLLLDESWSLGVLGDTGRGLPEQLGVERKEIEISLGSLASAFGSAGGFCAGDRAMVEHQRITSLAYTFSATMPAYLANTTTAVVECFSDPHFRKTNFDQLRKKARLFHDIISRCQYVEATRISRSPMIILRIPNKYLNNRIDENDLHAHDRLLQSIVDQALSQGVLITRLKMQQEHELFPVEHAIKIIVPNGLTVDQIRNAAQTVCDAFKMKLQ